MNILPLSSTEKPLAKPSRSAAGWLTLLALGGSQGTPPDSTVAVRLQLLHARLALCQGVACDAAQGGHLPLQALSLGLRGVHLNLKRLAVAAEGGLQAVHLQASSPLELKDCSRIRGQAPLALGQCQWDADQPMPFLAAQRGPQAVHLQGQALCWQGAVAVKGKNLLHKGA